MPRVTADEVRAIMNDLEDALPGNLDGYITGANLLITQKLSDEGYSDEYLTEIERWLSAHFIACDVRQPAKRSVMSASESFVIKVGQGLEATLYGQTAKLLDTSGKLDLGPGFEFEAVDVSDEATD